MQYMQVAVEGSKRQVLSVVRLKVVKPLVWKLPRLYRGSLFQCYWRRSVMHPMLTSVTVVGTVQKKSKSFITHVENILRQAKSERHPY